MFDLGTRAGNEVWRLRSGREVKSSRRCIRGSRKVHLATLTVGIGFCLYFFFILFFIFFFFFCLRWRIYWCGRMAQIVNVCSYRLLKIKDVGGASLVTQASMINSPQPQARREFNFRLCELRTGSFRRSTACRNATLLMPTDYFKTGSII